MRQEEPLKGGQQTYPPMPPQDGKPPQQPMGVIPSAYQRPPSNGGSRPTSSSAQVGKPPQPLKKVTAVDSLLEQANALINGIDVSQQTL